jgi:TPR repeat protein
MNLKLFLILPLLPPLFFCLCSSGSWPRGSVFWAPPLLPLLALLFLLFSPPRKARADESPLKCLLEAAKAGEIEAQYQLGWAYDNGHRVEENKIEAMIWYVRAAKGGHHRAEGKILGILKSEGAKEALDMMAADWRFEGDLAAVMDFPEVVGDVVPKLGRRGARPQAFAFSRRDLLLGAARHEPVHMFNIGIIYDLGLVESGDPMQSTRWHRRSAFLGLPDAQNAYGRRLLKGEGGLAANLPEANKWLRRAADKGFAASMFHLWELSRKDPRIVSREEGLALLIRSAEQGWPDSEFRLSLLYLEGDCVPQDHAASAKWLKRAALKRHAGAMEERARRRL